MTKLLIIESPYYPEITNELSRGAIAEAEATGVEVDHITVPGVLELPAALAIAHSTGSYDGYVMLGCVIRGETSHYDIVAIESARAIMDFAVRHKAAVGNGILTVENRDQAKVRADVTQKNKGADAARAALAIVALKKKFGN